MMIINESYRVKGDEYDCDEHGLMNIKLKKAHSISSDSRVPYVDSDEDMEDVYVHLVLRLNIQ
jgi:hypothetical protein